MCNICQIKLKASSGKTDLLKHKNTAKHKQLANSTAMQPSIKTVFEESSSMKSSTMKAELQIAAYIASHGVAFNSSDHLVKLMQNCCSDSKIAKNITCGRTKTTGI